MKKLFHLFIFAILGLMCGCVPSEFYLRTDWDSDSKTPVKIAALLPLSGKNRIYAEQMQAGVEFAALTINSSSGVAGRRLEVRIFDTKGSPGEAFAAMEKAAEWGAAGVVAGYSSSEVSAIIARSSQLRLPTVIPLATADQHSGTSPFVFRNSYTDHQQAIVIMGYLFYWRKIRQAGILIDRAGDTEYVNSIGNHAALAFSEFGGSVVKTTHLESLESADEKIKEMLMENPSAVLLAASGERAAELIKKLRKSGFRGIICGPDSWDDDSFIRALEGFDPGECVFTAFFSDENNSPEYQRFKKGFREKNYYYPAASETQSYDAVQMLAIGLSSAETLIDFDRNWRSLRNYVGAAGVYTMLKNGEIDRTVYINSIGVNRNGGKLVPYSRLSHKLQFSQIGEYRELYDISDEPLNIN